MNINNSSINQSAENIQKENTFESQNETNYIINIELAHNIKDKITINANSKPEEIAYNFCHQKNLDYNSLKYLINKIKTIKESIFSNSNLFNEDIFHENLSSIDRKENSNASSKKNKKIPNVSKNVKNKKYEKKKVKNSITSYTPEKNNEKKSNSTKSVINQTIQNCLALIENEEKNDSENKNILSEEISLKENGSELKVSTISRNENNHLNNQLSNISSHENCNSIFLKTPETERNNFDISYKDFCKNNKNSLRLSGDDEVDNKKLFENDKLLIEQGKDINIICNSNKNILIQNEIHFDILKSLNNKNNNKSCEFLNENHENYLFTPGIIKLSKNTFRKEMNTPSPLNKYINSEKNEINPQKNIGIFTKIPIIQKHISSNEMINRERHNKKSAQFSKRGFNDYNNFYIEPQKEIRISKINSIYTECSTNINISNSNTNIKKNNIRKSHNKKFRPNINSISSCNTTVVINNLQNNTRLTTDFSRISNEINSNNNSIIFNNNKRKNIDYSFLPLTTNNGQNYIAKYTANKSIKNNILIKNDIVNSLKKIFRTISKDINNLDVFSVLNRKCIPNEIYEPVYFIIKSCNQKKRFITFNEFILQGTKIFNLLNGEEKIAILNFNNN